MPPLTTKKLPKIRKNQEEIRKKSGKIGKKEEKSGRKGNNWEVSFTLPLLTDRAGYATVLTNTYPCIHVINHSYVVYKHLKTTGKYLFNYYQKFHNVSYHDEIRAEI